MTDINPKPYSEWTEKEIEGFKKQLESELQGNDFQGLRSEYEDDPIALKLIDEIIEDRTIHCKLSDLSAKHIDKFVSIDCQITGEQSQKALEGKFIFECEGCQERFSVSVENDPKLIFHMGKTSCPKCGKHTNKIEIKYMDHSIIFCRDILKRDDSHSQSRYESKKVYVFNSTLPNTKVVNVFGLVVVEPKTNNISIIASKITALKNTIEEFRITDDDKAQWPKYFGEGFEIFPQINPDIVGEARDIAKEAVCLQLHSPPRIEDIEHKKIIRGGINLCFIGDTKTGKSQIAKDVTNKGESKESSPLGEYVVAETGGRTGILYTIDTDNRTIIWGSIPLNDLGLVVIDGLQSIHSEEMGEMRETFETQEVNVNRSVKGSALGRTRITCCMNPGKQDDKPMNHYIYPVQAIPDSWVYAKTPDITRMDIFVPFAKNDVPTKEITHRESKSRPIPNSIFERHVYWAWSRTPGQIQYTEAMIKLLRDESQKLVEGYSIENLPIVHLGIREVLTRLAVAKACEMHSVDETHEKVIVESAHVQKAIVFYKKVLDLLKLKEYKDDLEGKSSLTANEIVEIVKDLDDYHFKILDAIKFEPQGSEKLADLIGVSSRTVKEYYGKLKYHELVDTRTGVGIMLTLRGIKLLAWGSQKHSEIGKKNFTNESNGEEKLHYFTSREEGG